jgi:hypothetical protein
VKWGLIGPLLPLVLFTPFEIGFTNKQHNADAAHESKHKEKNNPKKVGATNG